MTSKQIHHNVSPKYSQKVVNEDVDSLKYFNHLSDQKQVSLLHSVISGRTCSEAQKFMQDVYRHKRKELFKTKFANLIKKAYPDIFLYYFINILLISNIDMMLRKI